MRAASRLVLLALLLGWPGVLRGADPALVWRVLETPRFRLVYNQDTEPLAAATLDSANRAWDLLERRLGFAPTQGIDLVLGDDTDSPNGFTFVVPYNRVILRAVPPRLEDNLSGLGNWLDLLVLHELTHVFTLERHSGPSALANAVFGRVALPNLTWPPWLVEGLAVHQESLAGRGRLQHPAFGMKLRMALLEGRPFALPELSGAPLDYPGAEAWYLYGGYFVAWLSRDRPAGVWSALLTEYGGRLLPYAHSILARRHLGDSWPRLYLAWLKDLGRLVREEEALRAGAPGEGTLLLEAGEGLPFARVLPDGDLLLVRSDGFDRPRLQRWRDGQTKTLLRCLGGCEHLCPAADGRIFFVGADWEGPYRHLLEPFVWSPQEGLRRLGEGLRCRELALLEAESRLLCSSWTPAEGHFLVELSLEGRVGRVHRLPQELAGAVLGETLALPQQPGQVLVSLLLPAQQRRRLALVDLVTEEWRLLDLPGDWNSQPELSPDGRWLLYSGEQGGRFQIWYADLEGQCQPQRLTLVPGGAFQPRLAPDGQTLVYASYHDRGYRLYALPFQPSCEARGPGTEAQSGKPDLGTEAAPLAPLPPSKPYFPLVHLRPRSWLPSVSAGSQGLDWVGLELSGEDPAQLERLAANVLWLPDEEGAQGGLRWVTERVHPILGLSLAHSSRTLEAREMGQTSPFRYQHSTLGADLTVRNRAKERTLAFVMGYDLSLWELSRLQPALPSDPLVLPGTRPEKGFEGALGLTFVRDGREAYRFSPAPERGLRLAVSTRLITPVFGAQRDSLVLRSSLDLHPRLLPPGNSLGLFWRGGAAMAPGSVKAFALGGYQAQDLIRQLVDGGTFSPNALRGFASQSLVGSQYQLGRLEAVLALARLRRGLFTWPLFFKDLWLRPLLNAVWVSGLHGEEPLGGVGAALELEAGLELGYTDPVRLVLGAAQGRGDRAVSEVYFLLGR